MNRGIFNTSLHSFIEDLAFLNHIIINILVIKITLLLKKDGIAINKEGLESAFWQNPVLLVIWFIPELPKGSPAKPFSQAVCQYVKY